MRKLRLPLIILALLLLVGAVVVLVNRRAPLFGASFVQCHTEGCSLTADCSHATTRIRAVWGEIEGHLYVDGVEVASVHEDIGRGNSKWFQLDADYSPDTTHSIQAVWTYWDINGNLRPQYGCERTAVTQPCVIPTPVPPTPTPVPPTPTPVPPTPTPIPPSPTPVPPTPTALPPTQAPPLPTATPAPSGGIVTPTRLAPTPALPTETPPAPTPTGVPQEVTPTPLPTISAPVLATATPSPQGATPPPPTAAPQEATPTLSPTPTPAAVAEATQTPAPSPPILPETGGSAPMDTVRSGILVAGVVLLLAGWLLLRREREVGP